MYKWLFWGDVWLWNIIECFLNAFKKLKGHSHHVWKFMNIFCTSRYPGSDERADPRRLTVASGPEHERDRGCCCCWEWQSFFFPATESDRVFFRCCWERQSSCCCWGRPRFFAAAIGDRGLHAASCWVPKRSPLQQGSESPAAAGSG